MEVIVAMKHQIRNNDAMRHCPFLLQLVRSVSSTVDKCVAFSAVGPKMWNGVREALGEWRKD
jgi:hypothetical protein